MLKANHRKRDHANFSAFSCEMYQEQSALIIVDSLQELDEHRAR